MREQAIPDDVMADSILEPQTVVRSNEDALH
jgi:hypothetical protein